MAVATDFIADVEVGIIPFVVQFTDTSTGAPDRWWWDFGDGSVGSADQNPTHKYLCTGDFSVTLTAWVETSVNTVASSRLSTLQRRYETSVIHSEANAWAGFLTTSFVTPPSGGNTRFSFQRDGSNRRIYTLRYAINRLDLTPYTKGDVVIILRYRHRIFDGSAPLSCVVTDPIEYWLSNDRIGDIPILKFVDNESGTFKTHNIQMISSPDLAVQFDHAGEIFDLEVRNGKTGDEQAQQQGGIYKPLFQQSIIDENGNFIVQCIKTDINIQRIGEGCFGASGNPFKREIDTELMTATVHEFSSIDSETKVNFITANSNVITRPPVLYSGIKEAYFKDGWENEKHFYIEQSKAQPCSVQFVDIYAETENE